MNSNSPDDWQTLFDELPLESTVDSTVDSAVNSAVAEHQTQALKQRVLQAYDERSESVWWTNQLITTGLYLMTHKTTRWAATAAALLLATWFSLSAGSQPSFAMEKLLETVLNARTVRFTITAQIDGMPLFDSKGFYAEPGKMRLEMPDSQVFIDDFELGKALILDGEEKTAMVMTLANLSDTQRNTFQQNGFTRLRTKLLEAQKNPDANIMSLGEKEIDGRKLIGFQFHDPLDPLEPMTIWADPETHHPFLIEFESKSAASQITMSKFEFDVELDETLFNTEVPAGYQRTDETLDFSKPYDPIDEYSAVEQSLLESLHIFSDASGGQFPDELSAKLLSDYFAVLGPDKVSTVDGQPNPATVESGAKVFSGFQIAAIILPATAQAHYAGKGVSHDENDRPIFWYMLEEKDEGQTWRVLGADLKFRDAASAPDIEDAVPLSLE